MAPVVVKPALEVADDRCVVDTHRDDPFIVEVECRICRPPASLAKRLRSVRGTMWWRRGWLDNAVLLLVLGPGARLTSFREHAVVEA
jgi:hypothetical protein